LSVTRERSAADEMPVPKRFSCATYSFTAAGQKEFSGAGSTGDPIVVDAGDGSQPLFSLPC
jgi:hypothetical protein